MSGLAITKKMAQERGESLRNAADIFRELLSGTLYNIALPDKLFRSFFLCFIDPVRLGGAAKRAPLQVIQGSI
jgi:hypothetical protein